MSLLQIIGISMCLLCIVAKWFFAHRTSGLNKLIWMERKAYTVTHKQLKLTMREHQMAMGDKLRLEAQHKSLQRNLTSLRITHDKMVEKQNKLRQQKDERQQKFQELQEK